jgi:hypothetical protein
MAPNHYIALGTMFYLHRVIVSEHYDEVIAIVSRDRD